MKLAVVLALVTPSCTRVVELAGPPRPPEPGIAFVGAPAALDPSRVPAPNAASACVGEVCLVPSLGFVSRWDAEPLVEGGAPGGPVATDGRSFFAAGADGLFRLSPEGPIEALGGADCAHVAWTGSSIVAVCGGAMLRLEHDELVSVAGSSLVGDGQDVTALVGLEGGAVVLGERASEDDDEDVLWAQPLDARGRADGGPRDVARSPFAGEAAALGLGDRLLVAWPGALRRVTCFAVLDGSAREIAAPNAPFLTSSNGMLAADGATGVLAWWSNSDGLTRVARIDRDGGLVPDVASTEGAAVGSFHLVSAVGLEAGPTILFGPSERRLLRFLPGTP